MAVMTARRWGARRSTPKRERRDCATRDDRRVVTDRRPRANRRQPAPTAAGPFELGVTCGSHVRARNPCSGFRDGLQSAAFGDRGAVEIHPALSPSHSRSDAGTATGHSSRSTVPPGPDHAMGHRHERRGNRLRDRSRDFHGAADLELHPVGIAEEQRPDDR